MVKLALGRKFDDEVALGIVRKWRVERVVEPLALAEDFPRDERGPYATVVLIHVPSLNLVLLVSASEMRTLLRPASGALEILNPTSRIMKGCISPQSMAMLRFSQRSSW